MEMESNPNQDVSIYLGYRVMGKGKKPGNGDFYYEEVWCSQEKRAEL